MLNEINGIKNFLKNLDMNKKRRIEYIDIAKGIAMLLIVIQHVLTYYPQKLQVLEPFFSGFRVPVFFVLSGLFFSSYSSFKLFLIKKVNTLIIPFIFFYLTFSVFLPNFLFIIGYKGLRQVDSLGIMSIFNFIKGRGYSNNPVWFLLALFWIFIFFYGIVYITKKSKYQDILIVLSSILLGTLGYVIGSYKIDLILNIDNALTAIPYFCFGYIIKMKTDLLNLNINKMIMVAIALILFYLVSLICPGIDYLGNRFPLNEYFNVYASGLFGTFGILLISKIMEKVNILKFYGRETLIILCMQMPVIQVVHIIINKFITNDVYNFVVVLIVTMCSFLFIIPIINKYIPWAAGKKALIKS
jgi:fucose 4-O-acetylase-like acetyltransferase